MKLTPPLRPGTSGSVLMITLAVTLVLGIFLGSYLLMVSTQNAAIARSQAWNAALAVAEAGVEEALAQLNPSILATNILAANGWSLSAGLYKPSPAQRTLLGGSYAVGYTPTAPPVIYATGYTTVPALSATLTRAVRVATTNAPLFGIGMVAKNNIDLKGNNIATDSYDSNLGGWNTQPPSTNGDVASALGFVNIGNADINGAVLYSASGGYTILPQGSYLSMRGDFNMDFPDVLPPFAAGLPLSSTGVIVPVSGGYMVNGDYSLGNKARLVLTNNATVTLYVTGDFSMNQNASIEIAAGSTLRLYVGGASTSFGQVNNAGRPIGFQYYGLPGNTSVSLGGNASLVGTVYAPNANFTASGGGNNTFDFQGAATVKTITMNGHFNFHYDESLRGAGLVRGYVATSWREL